LDPSLKKLYREVMLETFRDLSYIERKKGEENVKRIVEIPEEMGEMMC
jgi:hypothetical protein